MINWEDFKDEILLLNKQGLSSSQINESLSTKYPELDWKNKDRQIRSQVAKYATDNLVRAKPKVLIYDIETLPLEAFVWRVWNQNIGTNMDQVISDWFCVTWAAKWLFEDNTMSAKLTPKEIGEEDDGRIMRGLWDLMDEANVVIAHNARRFDNKRVNTRFILNNLNPPSHYQTIDTLDHLKKQFAFSSNKLDYVNKQLGIGRKIKTEFNLWKRCKDGDAEALAEMEEYNVQDVLVLEETYLRLRPYIKPHPNMGLHIGSDVAVCPNCGSTDLKWSGEYHTYVNVYDAFRCNHCGAVGRSKRNNTQKSIKDRIVVSTP